MKNEILIAAAVDVARNNAPHGLLAAARFLNSHNVLHFGVESAECAGRSIHYINFGETYALTVCYSGGEFALASWGSMFEETENEHCRDSGEIRCGYCSAFTMAADEWRETICESCGRNVSSGELPAHSKGQE